MPSHSPTIQGAAAASYALVWDTAASWGEYERVALSVGGAIPEGLIVQVAGPTDEGFRVIGIWESEQAWEHFHVDRLAPAIAALGRPVAANTRLRALRPRHVLIADSARHLQLADYAQLHTRP
jgi:hypothetical protein